MIYWASNFLYDFASLICVLTVTVVLFAAFQIEGYNTTAEHTAAFLLNFVLFAMSVIPFIYLFTFVFRKHTSAWISLTFLTLFSGVLLMVLSFMLNFFDVT